MSSIECVLTYTQVPRVLRRLTALHTLSFKGNRLEEIGKNALSVSLRALILSVLLMCFLCVATVLLMCC
jgi:Leucine-rich repeat (LRR) protein